MKDSVAIVTNEITQATVFGSVFTAITAVVWRGDQKTVFQISVSRSDGFIHIVCIRQGFTCPWQWPHPLSAWRPGFNALDGWQFFMLSFSPWPLDKVHKCYTHFGLPWVVCLLVFVNTIELRRVRQKLWVVPKVGSPRVVCKEGEEINGSLLGSIIRTCRTNTFRKVWSHLGVPCDV